MTKILFLSVDFQKDFTDTKGFAYGPRKSVDFMKQVFIPFLQFHNIKTAEIISDYREIPLSKRWFFCQPGTPGYESEIPDDVKTGNVWVKCQHSPIWTRENIWLAGEKPGEPYADPRKFEAWLSTEFWVTNEVDTIVLVGLTVNCCVLSVAQELYFRGYYNVKILEEATDDYGGTWEAKENALKLIEGNKWAGRISWEELRPMIENNTPLSLSS